MKISSMSAEERVRHLTEAPIPGLILELSLPTVISMLVTSLYNMVDTAFVGQLNTQSTAAVGISYSAMALLQAVSFFFGHGSGNYISRKLGAREYDNAERMASTAFFSAVFCGCVLAVLGVVTDPTTQGKLPRARRRAISTTWRSIRPTRTRGALRFPMASRSRCGIS